jgi:DNA-binding LytR/AlgR family response regulator
VDAFSYKVGHNTVKVAIRDIIYFESCDHKIKIHFYVQNTYKKDEFYGNMDHVQQQLGSFQFLRIHKAFLVNPLHVKRYSYDELYMSIGVILPIAQSKRKEIRAAQFLL